MFIQKIEKYVQFVGPVAGVRNLKKYGGDPTRRVNKGHVEKKERRRGPEDDDEENPAEGIVHEAADGPH